MSAITSFSTLRTSIVAQLNRSDLAASATSYIQLGERRIYRDLRVRQMETALSSVIASGVIALPTGYIDMKFAYVNGTPVQGLLRKSPEWIYGQYPTRTADGKPKFFAREGNNLIFGPYPDSSYTINGIYYKRLTELSDANPTNWLIDDAPDLILYASLLQAVPYLQDDPRVKTWYDLYEQAKTAIKRQDAAENFSGSPLQMTAR